MKKVILLFLVFVFTIFFVSAQHLKWCTVEDNMNNERIVLEEFIKEQTENSDFSRSGVLTIPVVVHVVYHDSY